MNYAPAHTQFANAYFWKAHFVEQQAMEKNKAVFNDARRGYPWEREIFLDRVCDGDSKMRREVEWRTAAIVGGKIFYRK